MTDYKKMYLALFNSVSDSIITLQKAEKQCEDLFISSCEDETEAPENVDTNLEA